MATAIPNPAALRAPYTAIRSRLCPTKKLARAACATPRTAGKRRESKGGAAAAAASSVCQHFQGTGSSSLSAAAARAMDHSMRACGLHASTPGAAGQIRGQPGAVNTPAPTHTTASHAAEMPMGMYRWNPLPVSLKFRGEKAVAMKNRDATAAAADASAGNTMLAVAAVLRAAAGYVSASRP